MASAPTRSFATLCAIAVLGLFGAFGAHGVGSRSGSGSTCILHCNGGATAIVVQGSHKPVPTPCVHDVGCGGGSVLTSSVTPAVAVFTAVGVALAALAMWRRRSSGSPQPAGVLLASALFRPPRPAFDV